MRFRIEQRFAAPLDAVESGLLDSAFLTRLAELPKLGAPELLDHQVEGDLVRQRVRYRFTGDLSPAVTAVVDPARLTWVEETTYDRRAHCGEHKVRPDHYAERLQVSYSTRLEPAADDPATTVRSTEGDVRVRFPFVGAKVEKAIVRGLTDHAVLETEFLIRWLAEEG